MKKSIYFGILVATILSCKTAVVSSNSNTANTNTNTIPNANTAISKTADLVENSNLKLKGVWVLEELNGKKANKDNFNNMLPLIEILTNTNRFAALLGCNRTNGDIFLEKDKLQFMNIASTKMACGENNKEPELIVALESVSTYSIDENKLILSNSSGKKLVFKKHD